MLQTQLYTFLRVCQTGSFSKAAEALFLTPSAVLHQMRFLETELGVTLFQRSSKGVTLTKQGEYLESQVQKLKHSCEVIRREIQAIGVEDKTICIGTSMMERCRLLYDLWILFSAEEKDCQIQMLNIDIWHRIPERTDMIESVNSGISWHQEWRFLEICKVPFGFAVADSHPLARRSVILLEDLRGEQVVTLNEDACDEIRKLISLLRDNGISCVCRDSPETNPMVGSAFRKEILLAPLCWSDILVNMKMIPFEHEFLLPYGIFYRPQPTAAAQRFINFIAATYTDGNKSGIVPVL
jgi:DNA-binding transcriptional LysR family regulator